MGDTLFFGVILCVKRIEG